MKSTRFIDGLRGLAAVYIAAGHARWLLWEGFSKGYLAHPSAYSPLDAALAYFFSAFRFGREAVIFFFLLSGFGVYFKEAARAAGGVSGAFSARDFFLRRARRIYPPLLLAIALTAACDAAVARGGMLEFFRQEAFLGMPDLVAPSHSWTTLAGNLLFLTHWLPPWGSNGPLWALRYEAWFYAAFPLLAAAARRSGRALSAAVAVLAALACAGILGSAPGEFARMLPVFGIGMWAARIYFSKPEAFGRLAWLGALFPALLAAPRGAWWLDYGWALAFLGLVSAGFEAQRRGASLRFLEALKPLGDFSYTFYVCHFPILVLLSGLVMKSAGGRLPMHFGWVPVGVGAAAAFAWAAHFIVEKPFASRRPA